MNYKKYSDEEILESYNTMLDYSGKAEEQILSEISNRGGLELLANNVSEGKVVPNEIKRIKKIVFEQYQKNLSIDEIKLNLDSNILSKEELDNTIDHTIEDAKRHLKDKSINFNTVLASLIGVIISSFLGALAWCFSIIQTGKMYYGLTIVLLIFAYILIRILTRRSANNVLVFIATFISAFIAIPLGLWFYSILTK